MPIKFCDVTEYIISVLARVERKVYWNSIRIFTPHLTLTDLEHYLFLLLLFTAANEGIAFIMYLIT